MSKLGLKTSAAQKGFTLIEMSIVLVIIGLIIGGILKGQEVIESSRQKNLITQVDATRAATNTFVDRYSALPGDYTLPLRLSANAVLAAGNGNGIVGAAVATSALIGSTNLGAAGENVQFFDHLAAAKLIDGVTILAAPGAATFGEGSPYPAVSVPGAGTDIIYGLYSASNEPRSAHWLRIHKTANGAPTAAFSPRTASELDRKVDDGLPAEGVWRTGQDSGNCGQAAGAAYTFLDENVICTMVTDLIQ
jgi:prepilin-type N-terminal cleavage/methylation domain-containing protein